MKPRGKRNIADKISRRAGKPPSAAGAARKNPFELYLTKVKHNIAGRPSSAAPPALQKLRQKKKPGQEKQTSHVEAQGVRSVARNTAFQNRKKTLLKEYKTHTKSNRMIDRRLGEKDATMTVEDKMLERVMFERKESAKSRKNLFNLNDISEDVEIEDSGFGQTLADVERLEEQAEESPVEDEMDEGLGEKFVSEHHFGGGLLTKKAPTAPEIVDDASRARASKLEREQLLGDIIAESKQKKYEKQTELDDVRDLTKSLDEKWHNVQMRRLVTSSFGSAVPEPGADSFDSLVKMLQFGSRAKGTDKLKSDAELAKEAKEELEKAEKKRQKRERQSQFDADRVPEEPDSITSKETNDLGLELLEPAFEDVNDDMLTSDEDDGEEVPEKATGGTQPNVAEIPGIPFVIPVPETRKNLEKLLADRSASDTLLIVTRIMKYHHLSLAEENRGKLTRFFKLLFDFLLKQADNDAGPSLEYWTLLTPSLYDLFRISKEAGDQLLRLRLEVLAKIVCRKSKFVVPSSGLLFLKFLTVCYPLEQHYQPVVAALNLVVGKLLRKTSFSTAKGFLSGLFVATIATDATKSNKRYFPELIGFLHRSLMEICCSLVSFPPSDAAVPRLAVQDCFEVESTARMNPEQPVQAFRMCMEIMEILLSVYSSLPAYCEIFADCFGVIGKLKKREGFPEDLTVLCGKLDALYDENRKPKQYLTFLKKKPAPLKMLEPRIDSKFDRTKSAKMVAVKRLQHDKKRAVKGAKRELRRDNQFIARVQLEEQIKKDATRAKKVKEIYSGLYSQQSEHKALQRLKARKKF